MLSLILSLFSILCVGILSYFYYRIITHYRKLISITNKDNFQAIVQELLAHEKESKKDIVNLQKRCDTIELDSALHIQKVGMVRFNPFEDTGGNQSFILALLDAHDTGVTIAGLYSRAGTRWYARKVVAGKGLEHELSDFEKKAIKQASTHE